jgi:hypothetical protein
MLFVRLYTILRVSENRKRNVVCGNVQEIIFDQKPAQPARQTSRVRGGVRREPGFLPNSVVNVIPVQQSQFATHDAGLFRQFNIRALILIFLVHNEILNSKTKGKGKEKKKTTTTTLATEESENE